VRTAETITDRDIASEANNWSHVYSGRPVRIALGVVGAALLVLAGGAGGYLLGRSESDDEATLTIFTPTGSQLAGDRVLPEQPELPDAVEEKRLAIARAAADRDYAALAHLLPVGGGFEYTFGGAVEGGPTAYWRRLEATTDEAPLDSLVTVLSLPYTKVRGIYVWPFAFDRDPKRFSYDELQLLSALATPRELAGWRRFGGYIGWRAGIEPDGDWIFFVAGD
jgi:hypothetical protein